MRHRYHASQFFDRCGGANAFIQRRSRLSSTHDRHELHRHDRRQRHRPADRHLRHRLQPPRARSGRDRPGELERRPAGLPRPPRQPGPGARGTARHRRQPEADRVDHLPGARPADAVRPGGLCRRRGDRPPRSARRAGQHPAADPGRHHPDQCRQRHLGPAGAPAHGRARHRLAGHQRAADPRPASADPGPRRHLPVRRLHAALLARPGRLLFLVPAAPRHPRASPTCGRAWPRAASSCPRPGRSRCHCWRCWWSTTAAPSCWASPTATSRSASTPRPTS